MGAVIHLLKADGNIARPFVRMSLLLRLNLHDAAEKLIDLFDFGFRVSLPNGQRLTEIIGQDLH